MSASRQKTIIALKKAHSLLAKVVEMTENGEYCIDVMQQNLAVLGLLKSAHQSLLDGHLNSCFKNAMASSSPKKQQQMIDEILKVTKLTNK